MPIVSKLQQRFMFANQHAPGKIGKVAREFISATPKGAFKKLPAKATPPKTHHHSFGSLDGK